MASYNDEENEDDDNTIICNFCHVNKAFMPVAKGWICEECMEDQMAEITDEEEFDDFM